MSIASILYPYWPPGTIAVADRVPLTVLILVPAKASDPLDAFVPELGRRLMAQIPFETAVPAVNHFQLRHLPHQPGQHVLIGLRQVDASMWKLAGGPIGLLELGPNAQVMRQFAMRLHARWSHVVAGTGPADPWLRFLDRHRQDDRGYPLARALDDFAAQPRIAAMVAAQHRELFVPDEYGPGLQAHQDGVEAFADYITGQLIYGDAVITLEQKLLKPADTSVVVEQTLAQRQAFHTEAGGLVAAADPATFLVAVLVGR